MNGDNSPDESQGESAPNSQTLDQLALCIQELIERAGIENYEFELRLRLSGTAQSKPLINLETLSLYDTPTNMGLDGALVVFFAEGACDE